MSMLGQIGLAGDSRTARRQAHLLAQTSRTATLLFIAVAAVGCGALAWWGVERDPKVALIVAMGLITSAPVVLRWAQGCLDPFEPIVVIAVAIFVMCVARPIVELDQHLTAYAPLYNAPAGFAPAMVVDMVGTIVLYVAYFSTAGKWLARRMRPLPTAWDADRSMRFVVGLLVVGMLLESVFVAQIGLPTWIGLLAGRSQGNLAVFRSSTGYFELGLYVAIPASLIALVAWRKRTTVGAVSVFFFCVVLSLLLTVRRGDRTFILALLLPLIVMWYLRRVRRPRLIAIVVLFLAFALGANFLEIERTAQGRQQAGLVQPLIRSITRPGHELGHFLAGTDLSEFSVLEIEMHQYQVGNLHFWPGSTITSLAAGLIPHSILHNKPLTPLQHLTWTLFPQTTGGGSFQPPMYGAFYADDGWISLVVLSLLVGIGMRAGWEYYLRNRASTGVQIIFAATLPLVIILARSDLGLTFAAGVFLVLPVIICAVRCSRTTLQSPWHRRQPEPLDH